MTPPTPEVTFRRLRLNRLLKACQNVADATDVDSFWPLVCENSRWFIKSQRRCIMCLSADGRRMRQLSRVEGDTLVPPAAGEFELGAGVWAEAFRCERSLWIEPASTAAGADEFRRWLLAPQPAVLYALALAPPATPARPLLISAIEAMDDNENRATQALGMLYAHEAGTVRAFLCEHAELTASQAALETEIGERKRAEKRIREQVKFLESVNTELDQFAHMISHDLKAPVRAIKNLSEWIEEDAGDDLNADVIEYLQLLRRKVRKLEGMIDGMMRYSRAVRDVPDPRVEAVGLGSVVDEAVDVVAPPPEFVIDVPAGLPIVRTDRGPLQQVFNNLIANAVHHHDRNDGRVTIRVEEKADDVEVTVSDDGPGIEPANHKRVFVVFQALNRPGEPESTGIGLAIVKRIVEDQGGTITLESERGHGATFRFTWPRRPAGTPAAAAAQA